APRPPSGPRCCAPSSSRSSCSASSSTSSRRTPTRLSPRTRCATTSPSACRPWTHPSSSRRSSAGAARDSSSNTTRRPTRSRSSPGGSKGPGTDVAPTPRLVSRTAAALSERRAHLDALLARMSGPPTGEALHDLRVSLRRVAALARLTGDVPHRGAGSALKTAARELRRALSVRRTQDVARTLLLARFRRDPRRRPVAERLAARLAKEGDPGPSPERTRALLARLRRAFTRRDAVFARLHDPLTGTADPETEKRLAKSLRRRLRRAARRLTAAGVPGPAGLHPGRILARDLRYGLEFTGDAMRAPAVLLPLLTEF